MVCRVGSSRRLRSCADTWAALVGHVAVVACAAVVGCGKGPRYDGGSTGGTAAVAPPLNDAEKLLARMAETYGRADTYADQGELRIEFRREGKLLDSKVPFALAVARPNQVRMQLYQAGVLCDGKFIWGWTEDLADYVWRRPAPAVLSLGEVYADDVLRSILTEGLAGQSVQMVMLNGGATLDLFRAGGERPELLSDDAVQNRPCRRIRVRRADGDLTYWIDRETLVLRRIDFPAARLALTLADPLPPTDVKMTVEFTDAQLNTPLPPEAFQFQAPPSAKIVDKLDPYVAVPPPPPPSQMLGKPAGPFRLAALDGSTVDNAALRNKTTVVLFWTWGTTDCLQTLAKANTAYLRLRDRPGVAFYAVNIDPAGPGGVSDAELRDVLSRNKIEIPAARYADRETLAAFDARHVPSLFILGPDGVVQDHETGLNPRIETELVTRVEKVLRGDSLVAEAQRRYADHVARYERSQRAQSEAATGAANLPKAAIAPATPPKTLKSTVLWKCEAVAKPGFLLFAPQGGPPRILVADGLDGIAELDLQGKVVQARKLELPKQAEEAVVSYWRAGVDARGKRVYVGSAGAQQQLHVFDADFKRLVSFPEGNHAGISDFQCADLDGDGASELVVGYWGVVGLQGVTLEGSRIWSNRRLPENVLKTAVTLPASDGKRLTLCTTGVMNIAVIDAEGRQLKELTIGTRAARLVACADLDGDGGSELAAIASDGPGADVAVGFDAAGRELWSYALPPGVQPVPEMQNELIVGGKLLPNEPGCWILAGADGTVHLLAPDGKPVDAFALGEAIRGLGVAEIDGRGMLLLSGAKSVQAVRLSR